MNKLFRKWNFLPVTVKSSAAFSVAMFLQKGLQSLSTPIFTRLMSTSEYEIYTVYYAWSTIITIVATLNLASGVLNNQLVKGVHSRVEIVSSLQGLGSVWAAGFIIVFNILYGFFGVRLSNIPLWIWNLMLFSFIFFPAMDLWTVSKRFYYEYIKPCIVMVVVALINFLIPLIVVLNSNNKGYARVITIIAVNLLVGLFFWILNLQKGKTFFSKKIWIAALAFNLPLLPHFLSLSLLNQMDKIMIERLCFSGQAAIYSVAHTVSAMIQLFMTAINFSLVPWTYQRLKAGENMEIAKKTNVILICVGGILCILMLFAPEVMRIMAPRQYYEAIYLIPPLAAGIFFNYLYQLFSRIELYHEKTRMMMVGSITCAVLNLILNYIFIKGYGYMAAAYTTLFCYLYLSVMHGLIARYITIQNQYQNKPYNQKGIYIISISVLLISFVIPFLYHFYFVRYLLIAVICLFAVIRRGDILRIFKYVMSK